MRFSVILSDEQEPKKHCKDLTSFFAMAENSVRKLMKRKLTKPNFEKNYCFKEKGGLRVFLRFC